MSTATHRVVNGQVVPLTPEEIEAIEAEWAANASAVPEPQPRDLHEVLLEEINEMRAALHLPPRPNLRG